MKAKLIVLSVLVLVVFAAVRPGPGQDDDRRARLQALMKKRLEQRRQQTKKKAPSKPKDTKITALVGGDIHTVTREVIRNGTLLIQNGKILDVGQDLEVPKGATILDTTGKTITPGFVTLDMSSSVAFGPQASSARTKKFQDYLDPFRRDIKLALGAGITTGCVQLTRSSFFFFGAPDQRFLGLEPSEEELSEQLSDANPDFGRAESTCPCCGLAYLPAEPITPARPRPITPRKHAVVKMSFGKLDGMLVKESAFFDIMAGSLSGPLNRHNWRRQIAQARKYLEDLAEHEKAIKAGKKVRPPRKTASDDLIRLVKHEVSLRTAAQSLDEIQDMVALAEDLDYDLVLEGVAEAWQVAEGLAEADVPVVITPRSRRRAQYGEERTTGSWVETPRVLEESGVAFAVTPLTGSISLDGRAGRDLTSLPLEAAFAVRGGASDAKALAAITIAPATMLGLEKRIGSIEKGKDADVLVLDGPPLDYRTYVETALVNGRVVYEREKDRVYPVFER